jgi:polysaccharide export outer membrane protein
MCAVQLVLCGAGLSHAEDAAGNPVVAMKKEYVEDYRLGADDILTINVYGEEDLNTGKEGLRARVSASGYITYPFIGKMKVAGMTVAQLEDRIAELLSKGYIVDPKVTIFCEQNAKVYVFGQVASPGAYPLITDMTLLSGIALAGGFTKIAVQSKVKLIRTVNGERKMYEVRINDIMKGDLSKDIELQRNDTIIVMESFL